MRGYDHESRDFRLPWSLVIMFMKAIDRGSRLILKCYCVQHSRDSTSWMSPRSSPCTYWHAEAFCIHIVHHANSCIMTSTSHMMLGLAIFDWNVTSYERSRRPSLARMFPVGTLFALLTSTRARSKCISLFSSDCSPISANQGIESHFWHRKRFEFNHVKKGSHAQDCPSLATIVTLSSLLAESSFRSFCSFSYLACASLWHTPRCMSKVLLTIPCSQAGIGIVPHWFQWAVVVQRCFHNFDFCYHPLYSASD